MSPTVSIGSNTLYLGMGRPSPYQNKSQHSYNGNPDTRQSLINFGHWNCQMGQIDNMRAATEKVEEMKEFISQHNLHVVRVTEADLHGSNSRIKR